MMGGLDIIYLPHSWQITLGNGVTSEAPEWSLLLADWVLSHGYS